MLDDVGHVHGVPNDKELIVYLNSRLEDACGHATEFLNEYKEVVQLGRQRSDPQIFAYARLLNRLAEFTHPELLKILSAFIYMGEPND